MGMASISFLKDTGLMELMQIINHTIVEGNGNLTQSDKGKVLTGLDAVYQ